MANLSDLTRKEQVLAYLHERRNQWVDGPELATEAVGGSEGLRRLRELRLSGEHDIRERRHPDPQRDIWQYRLVTMDGPHVPKPLDLDVPDFDDAKPSGYPDPEAEAERREEEATRLLDLPDPEPAPSPWPADHGQTRMSSAIKRKEDGTFEYVPPQRPLGVVEQLVIPPDPPQPEGDSFTSMPTKISWGDTAICPRCRMKTTRGRKPKPQDLTEPEHVRQRKQKKRKGSPLIDSDGVLLFRDPVTKESMPCRRCNGYGVVPNKGPIPITMPDGPGSAGPVEEAPTMELEI